MVDIFISYSQQDYPRVKPLVDALTAEGYRIWWDPEVRAGEHVDQRIEAALKQVWCVIVVWSRDSVISHWVRAEAAWAQNHEKLISIRIDEEIDLPLRFYQIHTPSLAGWEGSRDTAAFQALLADISKIGRPSSSLPDPSLLDPAPGLNAPREPLTDVSEVASPSSPPPVSSRPPRSVRDDSGRRTRTPWQKGRVIGLSVFLGVSALVAMLMYRIGNLGPYSTVTHSEEKEETDGNTPAAPPGIKKPSGGTHSTSKSAPTEPRPQTSLSPAKEPTLPSSPPAIETKDTDLPPHIATDGACSEITSGGERRTFREYRAELRSSAARQVILPEIQIFADDELTKALSGLSLRFQSEVTVLRWNQGRLNSHLVKFTTERGPRCGWIEKNALLPVDRNQPLPIETLRADGIGGFTGRGSTLDAKVLIRNRFDKDDPDADTTTGARVYYRYTDAEPYSTLRIFNVLNVFDYAEHHGEVWFFVGGERATADGGVKQYLYGWVRADEVIPWSSLVNVYYMPGKDDIHIYENNSEAERGRDWFAKKGDGVEPPDRNIRRFPLLDTIVQGQPPVILHQIAFPSTACDSSGHCISAQATALKRAELGDELWKAENIDFLFVIDATESMGKYFGPVVKGIRAFLRETDPGDRIKLRFSVVVYGDFLKRSSGGRGFQFARVIPFGSTKNEEQLEYLTRAGSFIDNMSDLPDAAFAALVKAVKEAAWHDTAGWHLVIWIGDHPNRGPGMTGNRPPAYTERDVVAALKKHSKQSVWTAINVRGNYQAPYNDLFMEQAEQILTLTGGWGIPPRRAYDAATRDETLAQITESVKDNLFAILAAGKKIPEVLARVGAGEDLDEIVPPDAGPSAILEEKYVKERLGMDDQDIRTVFSRGPLWREGWIRQDPQDPDWAYWLSVKPDEMAEIVAAAENLCETLSDTAPDFNRIKDAMMATLRSVTGDVPKLAGRQDETNIRDFLSKRLHVPKEQFSELLAKDIDGFVDWFKHADHGERNGFSERICKKSALLRMAQRGQRVDGGTEDIIFGKRLHVWQAKEGRARKFNWIWGTEHGIHYYYIPLDYVL
ncbi:toll/interleukin-1 receptor domain-containing protein [Candidatus Thiosymbion oneisti]|uniref:toll/interleukin-1 receptor domain-containing protein n=1 Tax=Candidatus Thiosymbion oneisti TaxID=589554 RepID=UPI0010615823|nr:toll/interleukin-1 receptor domain-containing protein [Candidatus Thiosymbion oneisti]